MNDVRSVINHDISKSCVQIELNSLLCLKAGSVSSVTEITYMLAPCSTE